MATGDRAAHPLAWLVKLPVGMIVSGMDAMVAASHRVRCLVDEGIDAVAVGLERAGPVPPPAGGRPWPATGAADAASGPPAGAAATAAGAPDPAALAAMVEETFNGLLAFVVPGSDAFSVAQGVSTPRPGGVAAGVTGALIHSFDAGQPSPPGGPPTSVAAAGLLNQIAAKVKPEAAAGPGSAFARLAFAEKAAVFAALENDPALAPYRALAGLLLFVPAALAYSEYGVFDFQRRELTGWPVGWSLSEYDGVSDGWDELKGYFEGRKAPLPSGSSCCHSHPGRTAQCAT